MNIILITILFTRSFSLLFYFLSDRGSSSLWNNWFLNTFDHYQLGFLLLAASYFILNRKGYFLRAFGLGLIIDEANQVLNVLTLNAIPYQYNSPLDWLLTCFFLLIFFLLSVYKKKNTLGKIEYFKEGNITYQVSGRGRPVIFLHGYGLSPLSTRPIIQALSNNFLVIAPYLLNGWRASNVIDPSFFNKSVDYLAKFIDSLNEPKPIIIGASMSGFPATRLALKYPNKISGLVILNGLALPPGKETWQLVIDLLREFTKNFFTKNGPRLIGSMITDFLINVVFHPLALINQATYLTKVDTEQQLPQLNVKTLILWGKDDNILPPKIGERLNKLIKNSRFEIVEGNHTWSLFYPEVFADEIVSFSNSLIKRSS